MKDKEALLKAETVFREKMKQAMDQRMAEWNKKKQEYLMQQMNKLKDKIIRSAQIELDKDEHLEIMRKKEEERRERDRKIAEQTVKTASSTTGSPVKLPAGESPEIDGFSRPDRAALQTRNQDKDEEVKQSTTSDNSRRAPKKEDKDDVPDDWGRGAFTSKRGGGEDSGPKKREDGGFERSSRGRGERGGGFDRRGGRGREDRGGFERQGGGGPPKFTNRSKGSRGGGDAAPKNDEDGAGGFGFRNANKPRGGKK